ncbi:MAG: EAL domain-containing protein [Colwellia sp.]|nr:EAL domain-containing protein [Colwellia sp.]
MWQSFSASKIHQRYQESLMDSVTERIISDFQEYFSQLRLEIDLFQQKHLKELEILHKSGSKASVNAYMQILNDLRENIDNTRLFALIDKHGVGSLKHITGDFLPDCEVEIASTVTLGLQKQLFLHRSEKGLHFDLLQPLSTNNSDGSYFFVAFNPDVLINLLEKFQLPHQQLFLMRSDHVGEVELTTEHGNLKYSSMLLNDEELASLSFIKTLPNTRWQLAIRLEPKYSRNLYQQGLIKAVVIWLLLSLIIYVFYRSQKLRYFRHLQMKQALAYVDNHDQLTGLANRAYFDRKLSEHIRGNNKINVGVAFHIDIDKFQVINNSFGYAVGDRFLNIASIDLKDFLPDDAIVSRLGNDEFAVLLSSLAFNEAKEVAHEIRLLFQKIQLGELKQEHNITVSIGVVSLDLSIFDTAQVFLSLGRAVRLAKEKGRNRVQIYQSDDEQLIQHANEMEVLHDITQAFKEDRFLLYRQKIKSLTGEKYSHYEVLVRIKSKQGNIISPNNFIPAAEKYSQIKQIDCWVIEKTFQLMSLEHYDNETIYSINLSGLTIADRDIYDQVVVLFERYKIAPERICFEVTETYAISHLKSALHFMNQMREFGCCFSLDDFGSGLSSFRYLQQLPVAFIKIDGVFVRDMDTNEVNRIFVENIKRTATAMKKKVVAEFVESAEIEIMLTEMGVDYGQGYYIHKPEPWLESTVGKPLDITLNID